MSLKFIRNSSVTLEEFQLKNINQIEWNWISDGNGILSELFKNSYCNCKFFQEYSQKCLFLEYS